MDGRCQKKNSWSAVKFRRRGLGGQTKVVFPIKPEIHNKRKKQQNITGDIEIKNNLTIFGGEGGEDNEGKGFQELL